MIGRNLLFLVSFIICINACKRGSDLPDEPQTLIAEPAPGQYFGFMDSIRVRAEISHGQPIAFIEVALINETSTPVLPVQTFHPNGNGYTLSTILVVDDRLLESGSYTLRIRTVIDGVDFNKRIKVNYIAEPRRLESLLVLTKGNGYDHTLTDLFSGDEPFERFIFYGDYCGSAVSSINRLFYAAGHVSSDLTAWNLQSNVSVWSVPPVISPPLPYFTSIYSDGNEVFVSSREARISGYSPAGLNIFRSVSYANGYFTRMLRYKSWLVAVFEPFNSDFSKLVLFNYPGGTVFREIQFQGSVACLSDYGSEGVLLFVNSNNGSSVFQYSSGLNNLIRLKDFTQGTFLKIVMPDDENAFIASGDGVYWYRPGIGGIVKIVDGNGVLDLCYDNLSGQLYVASDQLISRYQGPLFTAAGSPLALSGTIEAIHLLYNK